MIKPPAENADVIDVIRSQLVEKGWKENSWYNYAYMDSEKSFIVSMWVRWNRTYSQVETIILPIVVALNELSHFMAVYGNSVTGPHLRCTGENFTSHRLPIGTHLRGPYSCDLLACAEERRLGNSDIESYIVELISSATYLYNEFKDVDDIINRYEYVLKQKQVNIQPLIYCYFLQKNYPMVRRLLDGTSKDAGGVFYDPGLRQYMEDYKLF